MNKGGGGGGALNHLPLLFCKSVYFISWMSTHVSNIVTKANQSGAVSLFRSSFETEEILTGWFSSNFDGLSQKI